MEHLFTLIRYAIGLLAYRIWANIRAVSQSNIASYHISRTQSALIIIIESAALYLASLIIFFVLTVVNSIAQFIMLSLVSLSVFIYFIFSRGFKLLFVLVQLPTIIGITFTGLIIRISLKSTDLTNPVSSTSRHVVTIGGHSTRRDMTGSDFELSNRERGLSIHVDVDKFVDTNDASYHKPFELNAH